MEKEKTLTLEDFSVMEPSGERPISTTGIIKNIEVMPFINEQYGMTARWILSIDVEGQILRIGVFSKVYGKDGKVVDVSKETGKVSMKSKIGKLMVVCGAKSVKDLIGKKVPLVLDPKNKNFYTISI